MNTTPFALTLAHEATARGLVGANATDPVVPDRPAAQGSPSGDRAGRPHRARTRLAATLHRMGDAVAPGRPAAPGRA